MVSAPEALIDLVAAAAWHPNVLHLCEASDDERVAAIALAAAPQRPVLHDINRAEGSGLLQQLSEEVGRIAKILAAMSDEEPSAPAKAPAHPRAKREEVAVDAPFIRSVIRARRLRDRYFQGALFADPAWDMLLDLMAARLEGTRVPVSSLCIAAAVPATTALRWIQALTDQGLFLRSADPEDGRRVYIELSEDAARAMNAYFRMLQRTSPAVI